MSIALLGLLGLVWLAFAAAHFFRTSSAGPVCSAVTALLLLDAVLYLACAWGVYRRTRPFYGLALAQTAANAVLSVTDQVGPSDVLVLAGNLLLVPALVILRRRC
jgi:hypothetical protein